MAQPTNPATGVRVYGWVPDVPSFKDYPYSLITTNRIGQSSDLRPKCPPVVDQGSFYSCMVNALAGAMGFDLIKAGVYPTVLSRLFLYYNCREAKGNVLVDSGTSMRLALQMAVKFGACAEGSWPYDISHFALKPVATAYADALVHRVVSYYRLQSLYDMVDCLAQGFPFLCGISIYRGFESATVKATGVVNLPLASEQFRGGHGVMIVGNVESEQRFIGRNSYGTGWGQGGYFTIPYAYLTNRGLAGDFWTVRR
jgi:C1A family cysteine protease